VVFSETRNQKPHIQYTSQNKIPSSEMNDESFSATASPSSSNSTFEFYLDGQFASTEAGIIIPTITGGLSFLSSSFIMITIYRSKQNTVYHRILFFLSFWDAIVSFCIALTTLPMPKDVIYDYKGPSYGNHGTCSMQAFLIFLGAFCFVMLLLLRS
jgi:hypothetical protein